MLPKNHLRLLAITPFITLAACSAGGTTDSATSNPSIETSNDEQSSNNQSDCILENNSALVSATSEQPLLSNMIVTFTFFEDSGEKKRFPLDPDEVRTSEFGAIAEAVRFEEEAVAKFEIPEWVLGIETCEAEVTWGTPRVADPADLEHFGGCGLDPDGWSRVSVDIVKFRPAGTNFRYILALIDADGVRQYTVSDTTRDSDSFTASLKVNTRSGQPRKELTCELVSASATPQITFDKE